MKHKTAELEGALLDAAVAKAKGLTTVPRAVSFCYILRPFDVVKFSPSRDWADGGPIIERERIRMNPGRSFRKGSKETVWEAFMPLEAVGVGVASTPLVAAMRAYVSSKFGEDVELP